jgi:hypothetical protein
MTDKPTSLDSHRGMLAQKATELRRLRGEVEADQRALKQRQDALEAMLVAVSATTWPEAVEKARYLLGLFAATPAADDPRRRKLIEDVLLDFERLLGQAPESGQPAHRSAASDAPNQGSS